MRRSSALIALVLTPSVAGCGSGNQASHWRDLRSVTITVQQPGIPPPGDAPRVFSFSTAASVARITAALNAHHIARAASPTTAAGCAGGHQITLRIAPVHASAVVLSAYHCAGQVTGEVSGDLSGFLALVGISGY